MPAYYLRSTGMAHPKGRASLRSYTSLSTATATLHNPLFGLPVNKPVVLDDFTDFVESNRTFSIEAEHYT